MPWVAFFINDCLGSKNVSERRMEDVGYFVLSIVVVNLDSVVLLKRLQRIE